VSTGFGSDDGRLSSFSIRQPLAVTSRPPATRTIGSEIPNSASTYDPITIAAISIRKAWRATTDRELVPRVAGQIRGQRQEDSAPTRAG
jgi:hypothetical protein